MTEMEIKILSGGTMSFISEGQHAATESNGGEIGFILKRQYDDVVCLTFKENHAPCEFEINLVVPIGVWKKLTR